MLAIEKYHVATEHSWESVRRRAGGLDWSNQPDPFRRWTGSALELLPLPASSPEATCGEILGRWYDSLPAAGGPFDLQSLGDLLFHSVALSARKAVPGRSRGWSLRVNPSSGNLHPTETWVAVRRVAGLSDGIYHYRADVHGLELRRRGAWVEPLLGAAGRRSEDITVLVVLTSIFWREAWKYRKRALRYCHLDAGHAAACILGAARAGGWMGALIGHFADDRIAELLDCRRGGEEPLLIIALGSREELSALRQWQLGRSEPHPPPVEGEPSPVSPREELDPEMVAAFASTCLVAPLPASRATPEGNREWSGGEMVFLPPPPRLDVPYAIVARARRSAVDHDPHAHLSRESLSAALMASLPQPPRDWANWEISGESAARRLVRPLAFVSRVEGVAPGAYWVTADGRGLGLMEAGDFSRVAGYLSLEQEMAAHAAVVFTLIGDLPRAFAAHGPRGWRYTHFEGGFLGQGLYLAAAAGGFSATGIGAFYDEEVHRFWRIDPRREGRAVYHFALGGRSVPEPGVVTLTGVDDLFPRRPKRASGQL